MHSVSPQLHNAAFRAANLNGVYLPFEVRDLGQFIQRMVNPESRELDWNLRGLSITAPHKRTSSNILTGSIRRLSRLVQLTPSL